MGTDCASARAATSSSTKASSTREALHNSWDKNDPRDAQVILHMLRIAGCDGRFNHSKLLDARRSVLTFQIIMKYQALH